MALTPEQIRAMAGAITPPAGAFTPPQQPVGGPLVVQPRGGPPSMSGQIVPSGGRGMKPANVTGVSNVSRPALPGPTAPSAPRPGFGGRAAGVAGGLIKSGVVGALMTPNEMGRAEVIPTGMGNGFDDFLGNAAERFDIPVIDQSNEGTPVEGMTRLGDEPINFTPPTGPSSTPPSMAEVGQTPPINAPTTDFVKPEATFQSGGETQTILPGQSVPSAFPNNQDTPLIGGAINEGQPTFQGPDLPGGIGFQRAPEGMVKSIGPDGKMIFTTQEEANRIADATNQEQSEANAAQQRFLGSEEGKAFSNRMIQGVQNSTYSQESAAREARAGGTGSFAGDSAAREARIGQNFGKARGPDSTDRAEGELTMEAATRMTGGDRGKARAMIELQRGGVNPLTGASYQDEALKRQQTQAQIESTEANTKATQDRAEKYGEYVDAKMAKMLDEYNQEVVEDGMEPVSGSEMKNAFQILGLLPDQTAKLSVDEDGNLTMKRKFFDDKKLSPEQTRAFLATKGGQAWMAVVQSGEGKEKGSQTEQPAVDIESHKAANEAAKQAGQNTYTIGGQQFKVK